MSQVAHYCQKCLAANSLGQEFCTRCGTRLLTENGVVEGDRLERLWIERCQKDAEEQQEIERREELRFRILANYHGPLRGAFEQCINEGFLFIDDGQISRGVRTLRRAAEM